MTFLSRRAALTALTGLGAALLSACTSLPQVPFWPADAPPDPMPPIVFVHGNGDTAALWMTTVWRFESNGWPRDRLHAIDFANPNARDSDGRTPLHMAAFTTRRDNTMLLLQAGADPLLKTNDGRDVLSMARKVRADEIAGEISLWILKGCKPGKPVKGC